MKKIRKGKKMLLMLLTVIIAIIAIIITINIINKQKEPETPIDDGEPIIELPETVYSNMEVRNVLMEYLKDNDQTEITMEIVNTTENKIESSHFNVIWIGEDEEILAQIGTYIKDLEVGQTHDVSVILHGDLTKTKQIKLIEK